jgi:valyl-tRNA synthetase
MAKELPKIYDPKSVEDEIYKRWEESGYFNPDNIEGEPYSIMMPPPNVTGVLHLGHSLENSLMDVMARFQRMQGKKVLLLPGTDHAAVATQAKVEKILVEKGIKNPREEFGREKLLEEIKKYAENSKSTILKQIRKMGTSCDWSRLAYTFDEKRSKAVNEVFVKMYNDGLIYRGYRVVNWSVKGQSTCSDDELEYKEQTAKLYTFKYGKDFPISIATTRPETKLGDTAVAVNPNDERYKKYIGQTFFIEVDAAKPLEIKIIADENVDISFGTGAVGVTPAHSIVDFEMYEKQKAKNNPIEIIPVIGTDGKMNSNAGKYAGLSIEEAREKFVAWLKENNLLEKEEDIVHNVGISDRFEDIVESLPMTQWFIDVNKKIPGKEKSLKELMHDAVAVGHNNDLKQKITITPKRFEKIYFNWIENLRDWCISRQIWWGHRIPVWYRDDEVYVSETTPQNETNFVFFHSFLRTPHVIDPFNWIFNNLPVNKFNFNGKLPTYDKPNFEKQFDFAKNNLKIDENTVLIGHSIGTVLAMNFLEKTNKKVKKLILVAPLAQNKNFKDGKDRPEIADYGNLNYNFEKIKKLAKEIIVFKDTNDHIILPNEPTEIAEKLNAKLIEVEASKPHFNCEECPEILTELKKSIWVQDEDTLDTWFSSGLWTFSTLGWPDKKWEQNFHPTNWMQMGYEILFFWMARMILMSTYVIDQLPFRNVYIHGILRSETGKKFSKSSGNTIDPIEIIDKYGCDALRLSLIMSVSPGNDSRFYEEKVESSRNFVNKLWNIARYIISNRGETIIEKLDQKNLTLADHWILSQIDYTISEVTENISNYNFSQASEKLREFTWNDFADWYIEISKFEDNKKEKQYILNYVLETLLKLWHPFMPFVTENIWEKLNKNNLLMVDEWPKTKLADLRGEIVGTNDMLFELIKEMIISIRNGRLENNIEPGKKIRVIIDVKNQESFRGGKMMDFISGQETIIKNLHTGIDKLEIISSGKKIENAIQRVVEGINIYIPLEELIDTKKEKEKAEKEIANIEKFVAGLKSRLENKDFTSKAPENVIGQQKETLAKKEAELNELKKHLQSLK